MNIANISIRRPVMIVMLMAALVVVGYIAYTRLPVNAYPNTDNPMVGVTTSYPGASPEEVQTLVSKPLEEALGTINGVTTITSESSENVSTIRIEFSLDTAVDKAAESVREKVSATVGQFPSGVGDPVISKFDPGATGVIGFSIVDKTGKAQPDELRRLADNQVKPRLERVNGVADVSVSGGYVRQIQVNLKLDELNLRRVSAAQVVSAIQAENQNLPGGTVTDSGKNLLVRTPGNFQTVDEIGKIVVTTNGGVPTYLRDVAEVKDGFEDVSSYIRLNGKDTVSISVIKQSGTNTVKVADLVKAELTKIQRDYPNLDIIISTDQSISINESTSDALRDLVLGGLFAALIVFLFFRNILNTVITVAGLPIIMIGTFAGMSALGLGLNMITLLALSLAVGLVIDDAIVVRENIFRHIERGETPREAAEKGTNEVSLSVLAMTLTVISVFLPIAFISGMIGVFFREFGLVVCIAVALSLFEAFTMAPMLSAHMGGSHKPKANHSTLDADADHMNWLDRAYHRLLVLALHHKLITTIIAVVVFVSIFALAASSEMGLMGSISSDTFSVTLQLDRGTPLETTDKQAREIEQGLMELPNVKYVYTTVGGSSSSEKATFSVRMNETGQPSKIESQVREKFANVNGLTFSFGGFGPSGSGATSKRIQVNVKSTGSLTDLQKAAQEVEKAMRDVQGTVDIESSAQSGKPEMHVMVDRERAARAGLSTTSVGSTLRTLLNGTTASRYRESGKEADIVVRLRAEDRSRMDDIMALTMSSTSGRQVPLRNVATTVSSTGPSSIRRVNREYQIVVGTNYWGRSENAVTNDIRARLATLSLPDGVTTAFGGNVQTMNESFASLMFTLLLSIIFVYMVLASQFNSFTQPLVLMLSLPLSVVGALLALRLVHMSLDMISLIGIILLLGLVTKNSILLVDFANRQREKGASREQAMLRAGPVRLRPILMTSSSLILGMLPVSLSLGSSGSFRAPMAVAVIGGLITSTLLTLVFVPVAYCLMDAAIEKVKRLRRREPSVASTSAADAPAPAAK